VFRGRRWRFRLVDGSGISRYGRGPAMRILILTVGHGHGERHGAIWTVSRYYISLSFAALPFSSRAVSPSQSFTICALLPDRKDLFEGRLSCIQHLSTTGVARGWKSASPRWKDRRGETLCRVPGVRLSCLRLSLTTGDERSNERNFHVQSRYDNCQDC